MTARYQQKDRENTHRSWPSAAPGSRMFGALLLCLAALWAGGCVYEEGVKLQDAYLEVYAAIGYKGNECGNRPAYPLVMIDEPSRYAVDACVFSIVRGECPFVDYPVMCFELYNTDVPGVGPELRLPTLPQSIRPRN